MEFNEPFFEPNVSYHIIVLLRPVRCEMAPIFLSLPVDPASCQTYPDNGNLLECLAFTDDNPIFADLNLTLLFLALIDGDGDGWNKFS